MVKRLQGAARLGRRMARRQAPSDRARGESRLRAVAGAATLALLVLVWIVGSATGLIDPARFPAPRDIGTAATQLTVRGYAGGTLGLQVWHSTRLVLLGFLVAAATGVPLGLLMGMSRRAEA